MLTREEAFTRAVLRKSEIEAAAIRENTLEAVKLTNTLCKRIESEVEQGNFKCIHQCVTNEEVLELVKVALKDFSIFWSVPVSKYKDTVIEITWG